MEIDRTVERFAFGGEGRERALAQLVPGTPDYYTYRALDALHRRDWKGFEEELGRWRKRERYSDRRLKLERRALVLRAAREPAPLFEALRRDLSLVFHHPRRLAGEEPTLECKLRDSMLSERMMRRRALRRGHNLDKVKDSGLEQLLGEELTDDQRGALLDRLQRPDVPGLLALIQEDKEGAVRFGTRKIHTLLLHDQLEELARWRPGLLRSKPFVHTWLKHLLPGPEVDLDADPAARTAHIERLHAFVAQLQPSFNNLKAHVFYHRLTDLERAGRYDRQLFETYLSLPRRSGFLATLQVASDAPRSVFVVIGEDHASVTGLPPVRDEQALVTRQLAHFLREDEDSEGFAGILQEQFRQRMLALTKILAGDPDLERWVALLGGPEMFQQLKDQVQIELTPRNPERFGVADPVTLEVELKNVPRLTVKVFELNTRNYYLAKKRELDTSLDLDGLVANIETVHEFDHPPYRLHTERFPLEGLDRPGVYVVELIGGGRSSRALIRKGGLQELERVGAAGHVFTVLDEDGEVLTDASLWLGEREYTADADGAITVPFSTDPRPRRIVLVHGERATLSSFDHRRESYDFKAMIHVERESLRAGAEALVIVRLQLRVCGEPVSLELLEEPRLSISCEDRDGVSSSLVVPDFAPRDDAESVHTFKVPPGLASVEVSVEGHVRSLSQGHKEFFEDSWSIDLNGIDASERTAGLHLTHHADGWTLSLLGKNGEPRPGVPLQLRLSALDYEVSHPEQVKTDPRGQVALGPLEAVCQVSVEGDGLESGKWWVSDASYRLPRTLHGRAGESLALALPDCAGPLERRGFSLLERRGDSFLCDRFAHLQREPGVLRLVDLPAGDYLLTLKILDATVDVRISAGRERAGWLVTRRRLLERPRRRPLSIAAATATDEALTIALRNPDEATRVHVIGTRFQPRLPLFENLSRAPGRPARVELRAPRSSYVSGRDLGDEVRYILERREARSFPGNLLARPGLLLNPWAVREAQTGRDTAKGGGAYGSAGGTGGRSHSRGDTDDEESVFTEDADCTVDFLAAGATLCLNQRPDESGRVVVPRAELGAAVRLEVVAANREQTVATAVLLPETPLDTRDLRLELALDADAHCTEKQEVSPLQAGDALEVADITTSRVESYDSLKKVFGLFQTLSDDATLRKFDFVIGWPEKSDEDKRALYSEHACHELSFFLWKKDPDFFAAVIRPYLACKKDKTFLDRFLLEEDLSAFLEPWRHARLNVVERILLARRLDGERPDTARHLADLLETLTPDLEDDHRRFRTALGGSDLSGEDALGFEDAKKEAVEAEVVSRRMKKKRAAREEAEHSGRRPRKRSRGGPSPKRSAPPPPPSAPGGGGRRSAPDLERKLRSMREDFEEEEMADEDGFAFDERADQRKRDLAARTSVRPFFRKLGATREWAENNYYRRRITEQGPELVSVNAFWLDYARHDGRTPFLSAHLARPTGNFTEMMLALAVLDVPFRARQARTSFDGAAMRLVADSPAIVFHQEIKPAAAPPQTPGLLVRQSYALARDRYRYEGGERVAKTVSGELLAREVYVCEVVLTNPSARALKLTLLRQIPRGALPVKGGFLTRGAPLRLEPYGTTALEYAFYFPEAGSYTHFPAHVAKAVEAELIAAAPPATLAVVDTPSTVDATSWDHISQQADDETLFAWLEDQNLARLDLDQLAWRLKDRGFYQRLLALLKRRRIYDPTSWSYCVYHEDLDELPTFLRHQEAWLKDAGEQGLEAALLEVDPIARRWYEHLEYSPLVHARAHRLGGKRKILNQRFAAQYQRFLGLLSARQVPSSEDLLAATTYLFLQDRIAEGLALFERVERDELHSTLQHDYLAVHAALYESRLDDARSIAQGYANHPVDRWRKKFAAVLHALDEAQGAAPAVADVEDRGQAQVERAAQEAQLAFHVERDELVIHARNIPELEANFYRMDIELLFSREPFVQQQTEQFGFIQPNLRQRVPMPAGGELRLPLPAELRGANLVIELLGGGRRRSLAHYAHDLRIDLSQGYGQVQVRGWQSGKPLAKVYVKVYARRPGGRVEFYKDGYTDLRGRFDYATLSGDAGAVERFALLVLSDDHGAVIGEAEPPQE